jgi:hypothetical protein
MIKCDIDNMDFTVVGGKNVLALELAYVNAKFMANPNFRNHAISAMLAAMKNANVTEAEKRQIFEILKGE